MGLTMEGERVNSKGNVPQYIPKGPRIITPIQKRMVKLIPFFPESISMNTLAKIMDVPIRSISQSLSTEFCINFLICEDENKNISRCNPIENRGNL